MYTPPDPGGKPSWKPLGPRIKKPKLAAQKPVERKIAEHIFEVDGKFINRTPTPSKFLDDCQGMFERDSVGFFGKSITLI